MAKNTSRQYKKNLATNEVRATCVNGVQASFFLGVGGRCWNFVVLSMFSKFPKCSLIFSPTCCHFISYPWPVVKDIVKDLTCVFKGGLHFDKKNLFVHIIWEPGLTLN
jgi:hypothetical protein